MHRVTYYRRNTFNSAPNITYIHIVEYLENSYHCILGLKILIYLVRLVS